jgi:hypothetical protein
MTGVTTRKPPRLALRPRRLSHPPFAIWFPLAVYALTRLIDVAVILAAQRHQIASLTWGNQRIPGTAP